MIVGTQQSERIPNIDVLNKCRGVSVTGGLGPPRIRVWTVLVYEMRRAGGPWPHYFMAVFRRYHKPIAQRTPIGNALASKGKPDTKEPSEASFTGRSPPGTSALRDKSYSPNCSMYSGK